MAGEVILGWLMHLLLVAWPTWWEESNGHYCSVGFLVEINSCVVLSIPCCWSIPRSCVLTGMPHSLLSTTFVSLKVCVFKRLGLTPGKPPVIPNQCLGNARLDQQQFVRIHGKSEAMHDRIWNSSPTSSLILIIINHYIPYLLVVVFIHYSQPWINHNPHNFLQENHHHIPLSPSKRTHQAPAAKPTPQQPGRVDEENPWLLKEHNAHVYKYCMYLSRPSLSIEGRK